MAYWTAVILLAQMAFIPCEGTIRGVFIPNILQVAMPIALFIGAVSFLIEKRKQRVCTADFLVIGLGLWGLIGMYLTPGYVRWKWYTNRFIYPMGFYYLARLIPLDLKKVGRAINVNLVAVGAQALLMVLYRRIGFNPLYPPVWFNGKRASAGPFTEPFTAAPYLVAWAPLFAHLAATAKQPWLRAMAGLGLVLDLFAITCTTQRAATLAALLSVAFLGVAPRLRAPLGKLILAMALVYVVAADSDMVSPLSTRMKETDQSREAYNRVGWEIIRSPYWSPFLGVGFQRARETMPKLKVSDDNETLTVWGTYEVTVADFAQGARPLHNLYLSMLVEFGVGGVILGAGILVMLCLAMVRMYLGERRGEPADFSMATSLCAGLVGVLAVGKFHNIYIMYAPLSVFWFLYGILVGRPDALQAATVATETRAADKTAQLPLAWSEALLSSTRGRGTPQARMSQPWRLPTARMRTAQDETGSEAGEKDNTGETAHRTKTTRWTAR